MGLTAGQMTRATATDEIESVTAADARSTLGLGTLATRNEVENDHVTNARLANMAQYTLKGRTSSGTGDPEDVTFAAHASIIIGRGAITDLPAASAANAGYLFHVTDTGTLYRSSGSAWQAVAEDVGAVAAHAALPNPHSNSAAADVTLTAGAGLTGGGTLAADRTFAVGAGTGITVNADDVALDTSHARNVDHSAVSVIAGAGLTGGGTIAADRTLTVGAGTGITVNADDVALDTAHARNVDHSAVTLTAGNGLTGGGTIEANRTFAVGAGTGITVNADDVALDTAHARNVDHSAVTLTAGNGLTGGGTIEASRTFAVGAGFGVSVAADAVAWDPALVVIQDQKSTTTDGGTYTHSAGTWRTRDLNTEVTDTHSNASLASNQITLTAGTYECIIWVPSFNIGRNQARLRNTTAGTTLLESTVITSGSASTTSGIVMIFGRFTVAASQALEVQHLGTSTQATNGFGLAGSTGGTEIYTSCMFRRVA